MNISRYNQLVRQVEFSGAQMDSNAQATILKELKTLTSLLSVIHIKTVARRVGSPLYLSIRVHYLKVLYKTAVKELGLSGLLGGRGVEAA